MMPYSTPLSKEALNQSLGEESVFDAPMMTASEDFSYYKQISPECFLTLGIGDGVAKSQSKIQHGRESAYKRVKAQVQIILDYLNGK